MNNPDDREELACLEAIRTIEENEKNNLIEMSNDFVKGLDAFQTLDELDEKYHFEN